jgi:WD40 repeat protein/serine/threonine protein kinase
MPEPPLERLEALFHEAADLEPGRRSAFLDARCAGDPELRAAVEALLRQDAGAGATESFLVSPLGRPEASTVPSLTLGQAAPPEASSPTIPGYEVLGEVGRGGMGVVYKVRQAALDRVVALKMMLTGAPVTAEHLARFRVEMEALGRLQHPNIVRIYEVGEWEGRPYFTMEYVDGPNLAQKLGIGPLAAQPAAHLVEVLARTMEAVHRCHVLHRDLKPANVLLQRRAEGGEWRVGQEEDAPPSTLDLPLSTFEPKITDFGLAKLAKDPTAPERHLTQAGRPMGTPCYMAPEQARGDADAIGPATDVYALGAILYEALTGRPPLEGTTPADTMARVVDEEPVPPTAWQPKLPRDLVTICLKCLEKDPRKRYAGAGALADDLQRFRSGEPIRARPVRFPERVYRWCRRRPVVAALWALSGAMAVALVVTALVYNTLLRRALTEAKEKAEAERQQLVRLNVLIGMRDLDDGDAFPALLRLTEALRLDENDPGEARKHRIRIATALRQCPDLEDLLVLDGEVLGAWPTPGGGWLAADTDGAGLVRVWDVKAGTQAGLAVRHPSGVYRAAISSDGRLLATACRDDYVRVWEIATGNLHLPPLPEGAPVSHLGFQADDRGLLTDRSASGFRLLDVTKRDPPSPVGRLDVPPSFSACSDDSRWVFTLDARDTGQVWDAAKVQEVGPPLKLGQAVTLVAFSPDGGRIALVGADNTVRVRDVVTGSLVGEPRQWPQTVTRVVFSPGGDRLVTVCADNTAWVGPVEKGERSQTPLRHESVVKQARFSPDGRLVVTGGDDNYARVWDATTGEPVTPFLWHNGSVVHASFSPDGKEVLTVGKDGVARSWRLRAPPPAVPGRPPPEGLAAPGEARSPDGRRLIRWGNSESVQMTDAATGALVGRPLRHTSTVTHAAFSPTGGRVVTAGDDNTARVWDAETGEPALPPLPHKGTVFDAAFSPDDRSIITASADHTARVWDAATAQPLTPPLRHPGAVARARFSPDGGQAVTVGADGTERTWDLTPTDQPTPALALLARVLAGSCVDEMGQLTPLRGAGCVRPGER